MVDEVEDKPCNKRARSKDDRRKEESSLPPGWKIRSLEGQKDIMLTVIEDKIDNIIKKKMQLVPPPPKQSQIEDITFKLDYVTSNIKISNTVTELEKVVKEVKEMRLSEEKVETSMASTEEIKRVVGACRSISEIENKVPEFKYNAQIEKSSLPDM